MKKILLSLMLMIVVLSVQAQVQAHDNGTTSTQPTADGTTITIPNFTAPIGNDVALIITTRTNNYQLVNDVSFNGMTYNSSYRVGIGGEGDSQSGIQKHNNEMWAIPLGNITSPITGDIDFNTTGECAARGAIAATFANVDQTTPVTGFVNDDNVGNSTFSISSAAGDIGVDGFGTWGETCIHTVGAGQTQLGTTIPINANARQKITMSYLASVGSTVSLNMSNSNTCTDDIHIAGNIVAASSTPTIPTMGEWALILFGLIVLSFGVVYVIRWNSVSSKQYTVSS